MNDNKYTKLSVLVNDTFTVDSVDGYVFKRWDPKESKMLVSQEWQKDFRKIYPVYTDKGTLDLTAGQLGQCLEAVFKDGKAELVGKTIGVKSNGQMGMDIRYFFNYVKPTKDEVYPVDEYPPDF